MAAAENAAAPSFSLPGDLSDLLLPGELWGSVRYCTAPYCTALYCITLYYLVSRQSSIVLYFIIQALPLPFPLVQGTSLLPAPRSFTSQRGTEKRTPLAPNRKPNRPHQLPGRPRLRTDRRREGDGEVPWVPCPACLGIWETICNCRTPTDLTSASVTVVQTVT